jgi:hypothetical protein
LSLEYLIRRARMATRVSLRLVVLATLAIVTLTGCGGGGATFRLDGRIVSVSGGGYASVGGYSGRTGCDSRHFVADYDSSTSMVFAFTRTTATLTISDEVFRFDGPPANKDGKLTWSQDFGEGGAKRQMTVTVKCPLPK